MVIFQTREVKEGESSAGYWSGGMYVSTEDVLDLDGGEHWHSQGRVRNPGLRSRNITRPRTGEWDQTGRWVGALFLAKILDPGCHTSPQSGISFVLVLHKYGFAAVLYSSLYPACLPELIPVGYFLET